MTTTTVGFRLSKAALGTIIPPVAQARQWALSYAATSSRPLLNMSQGVPGTPPPEILLKSLASSSSSPASCGYGPVSGDPAMRRSLAEEMKAVYGNDTDITDEDICITAGCNMAFVASVMAIADAGDEIILPIPWYFNHQMSLSLLGINAISLPTAWRDGFLPSPELCAELITSKTKAIVLVTPNNPTGAIYSPSLIASFATLARSRDIALIMDETYRDFILCGPPHNLFSPSGALRTAKESLGGLDLNQSWRSHLIHLFSFSKSYCIPGHRMGAIVASPALIHETVKILDCIQICAPRPTQLALQSVLRELRPYINETTQALAKRHQVFHACLPPKWHIGSQGAYFAFVRHPWVGVDATEVSRRLACEAGVVTLPAGFFTEGSGERHGARGGSVIQNDEIRSRWIRFSIANVDDEEIKKVCERLKECEHSFGWELEHDMLA